MSEVIIKENDLEQTEKTTNYGGIEGANLRQYIEKVEKLEEEKKDVADSIKDVFGEAKANGFDPKIMRVVIKIRKMTAEALEEEESILDIYKHALGMIASDDEG